MPSEHEVAVARAARLRRVIEECERILDDPQDPRREAAYAWLSRLTCPDLGGPRPMWAAFVETACSPRRHKRSGDWSLAQDAVYEGWD